MGFNAHCFCFVAGALKLVSHPNVVRLEAVHEDPRSISIVMTLCRGGDLWDKVSCPGLRRAGWVFDEGRSGFDESRLGFDEGRLGFGEEIGF